MTWSEHQIFIRQQMADWRKTPEFKQWFRETLDIQDGLCYYCSDSIRDRLIHVEHAIPVSHGGTNDPNNLVLSCAPCNKNKAAQIVEPWRAPWHLQSRSGRTMMELHEWGLRIDTGDSEAKYITFSTHELHELKQMVGKAVGLHDRGVTREAAFAS